ncbi:hypothetical protein M758_12G102400 [Ceratodon purpureus]|nr:hypothetical protein M758_12G102400 [Ceratodon purpureus]
MKRKGILYQRNIKKENLHDYMLWSLQLVFITKISLQSDTNMRAFFNFSPTSLMDKYLLNRFRSAGLVSKFIEIGTDGTTTMHCWAPKERPAGEVEKPALLMLHGFGSTAVWQWHRQISALQPFFDIYVPDLLFFGHSFTSKKERTEIFQAECVMELMRCLGVPEFSVLGTSYGGFVAFRMAHMFPAAVKKVIISNSGILMTPEDNVNLASRGHVNTVVDLLLPATPDALSATSTLVFNRPLRLPRFLLDDFWSVVYSSNRREKEELVQGLVLGTAQALPVPQLQQVRSQTGGNCLIHFYLLGRDFKVV